MGELSNLVFVFNLSDEVVCNIFSV